MGNTVDTKPEKKRAGERDFCANKHLKTIHLLDIMLCALFTCVSVSMSDVATSKRLGRDRYLFSLN